MSQQPRLGGQSLRGMAELRQCVLREVVADGQAFGKSAERRLQQLEEPLVCTREDRCERDAKEIESRRKRKNFEVGDGDDAFLFFDDEWIVLSRVELDAELLAGVVEGVARRAMDVWEAAERQRILQVASRAVSPEVAPGEEKNPIRAIHDGLLRGVDRSTPVDRQADAGHEVVVEE